MPPEAKFQYEFVVGPAGVPGEHVTVQAFAWNSTDGGKVREDPTLDRRGTSMITLN